MTNPQIDLDAQIRAHCTGEEIWRVQDPSGAYCIEFGCAEHINPERECREWFADHQARFPESVKQRQYAIAKVRVFTKAEELALAAADELIRLARSGAEPLNCNQVSSSSVVMPSRCFRDGGALSVMEVTAPPEPVHWRAVLDPVQVPQQLNHDLHVVGFRNHRAAESWVASKLDFDGWRYSIEPLYAAPAAQPAPQQALDRVAAIPPSLERMAQIRAEIAELLAEDAAIAAENK